MLAIPPSDVPKQDASQRQRIADHLDKLHRQRIFIGAMESEGKDVRSAREMLREMLYELDTILAAYQQSVGATDRGAWHASELRPRRTHSKKMVEEI